MRELAVSTANIGFDSIDAATKFLEQPTRSGAITLVAGVRLMNYRKHAFLLALESSNLEGLWPQLPWEERPLKMAGELLELNGLWKFELLQKGTPVTDDPWCAVLDAEHIDALALGRFQPGDRFSPLGMAGKSMKLGDYWTNEGLPVPARGNWPLLRCNEQIAWVPGFTINERFKVTKNTRKTISLRVFKAD
jgi:tRNA(Ile)-lysidine synthase